MGLLASLRSLNMTILVLTIKWLRMKTARRMAKRQSSIQRKREAKKGYDIKQRETRHGHGLYCLLLCLDRLLLRLRPFRCLDRLLLCLDCLLPRLRLFRCLDRLLLCLNCLLLYLNYLLLCLDRLLLCLNRCCYTWVVCFCVCICFYV